MHGGVCYIRGELSLFNATCCKQRRVLRVLVYCNLQRDREAREGREGGKSGKAEGWSSSKSQTKSVQHRAGEGERGGAVSRWGILNLDTREMTVYKS